MLAELARLWDQAQHHTEGKGPQLTPALLARESGVPGSTVSSWANGTALPRDAVQLDKVGKVLARLARESAPKLTRWEQLLEADQAARQALAPAGRGPGRLIRELDDPFVLEVHRPVVVESRVALQLLPPYVRRGHDEELAAVVAKAAGGRSALAVLVGGPSTGKTRACWEAVHQLPAGWRLWHPFDPTRPEALLADLARVGPRTVVWLNETQRYLITASDTGERVAAALRTLTGDHARAPVLVLGTLRQRHWHTLTRSGDEHAEARAVLDGTIISVPGAFTGTALADLQNAAAGDPRLAAAALAPDGRATQHLAGVPALLDCYRNASPAGQALIHVAMDARRLGHGLALPLGLLEAAAPAYLADTELDAPGDWLEEALDDLAAPCKGVAGPLTRIRARPYDSLAGTQSGPDPDGPAYRLADYLDEHGWRHRADLIPPVGFWAAACRHARPDDQDTLSNAAYNRGLYRVAAQMCKNATTATGNAAAAAQLVTWIHEIHPADRHAAEWAVDTVALDNPAGVARLLDSLRKADATQQITALLDRDLAANIALDNPNDVARLLGSLRKAGATQQAAALADRAAANVALDNPHGVAELLLKLREAGNTQQAAALANRAAACVGLDDPAGVARVLSTLREAGATQQAAMLAQRAATSVALDNPDHVVVLLGTLRKAGATQQAAALADRAAASGALDDPWGVASLLSTLREAGYSQQAAVLLDRDPAANVALDHLVGLPRLLKTLQEGDATQQAAALLDRITASVALDSPWSVASVLSVLREAGAAQQAAALLDRDPAANVALDNPNDVPWLLGSLLAGGATQQATTLADRAAACVTLDNPVSVAMLLHSLGRAGAAQQAVALIERDPAASVTLDNPADVGFLLNTLQGMGATQQAATLAGRAAVGVTLDDSLGVAGLLDSLRRAGASQEVAILNARLPSAGMFHLPGIFHLEGVSPRFRFGREINGDPAKPWGWTDLG